MDVRDQRIAELEGQLAAATATIDALKQEVASLKQTVATLIAQLGQNSRNSHLPPSSDGPAGRAGQSQSQSTRKRGGQPGHKGHKRDLIPVEQVDRVVELYPSKCESCWRLLPSTRDAEAMRYQVIECLPIRPDTTEFRCNAVTCTCGYTTTAAADSIPRSPFGPRLMSLIGLFTGVYHLSRRTTVALLSDVLGVEISLGAVSAVEARVSEAVAPVVVEVAAKVESAAVKHTDATSWLQSGKLRCLWTIATTFATVFKIFDDGGSKTIRPFFGALTGILVSDRAKVFSFWHIENRQICWAHLLRKFVSFSEAHGPARKIGLELLDLTALVFNYRQSERAGTLERKTYLLWMATLRPQFEACLARAVAANIKGLSGSCADILEHQPALWTFVENAAVDCTNNHAERELRAFVLWRKRCFGTQSERGNLFAERLMTLAHTARKQHQNVLAFLTACCTTALAGNPRPSLFPAAQLTA